MATPAEQMADTGQHYPQAIEQPKPLQAMGYQGAFSSADNFVASQRMARALCASTLVPKEYQGEPNLANCIIALEIAQRVGASPLMVMQNLYVVHGRPAWSAQYIIAALNACGRYEPLAFHMVGERGGNDWGCYVTAKVRGTTDTVKGPTVTMGMAHAEGWVNKNGSKWKTMPEVMLRYRAASFFGKVYAPEILMGMQSVEEVHDIIDVDTATGEVTNVQPGTGAATSSLKARLQASREAEDVQEDTPADAPADDALVLDGGPIPPTREALLAQVEDAQTDDDLDYLRGQNEALSGPDKAAVTKAINERAQALRGPE